MPARQRRQRTRARALHDLGMRVEHLEDPVRRRHRLLQVGVHAAETLDRRVEHERREDEREKVALASSPPSAICCWPYQSSATIATPPRNSMIGGSSETVLVIFRLVR